MGYEAFNARFVPLIRKPEVIGNLLIPLIGQFGQIDYYKRSLMTIYLPPRLIQDINERFKDVMPKDELIKFINEILQQKPQYFIHQ